jgi:hypothetical protein
LSLKLLLPLFLLEDIQRIKKRRKRPLSMYASMYVGLVENALKSFSLPSNGWKEGIKVPQLRRDIMIQHGRSSSFFGDFDLAGKKGNFSLRLERDAFPEANGGERGSCGDVGCRAPLAPRRRDAISHDI